MQNQAQTSNKELNKLRSALLRTSQTCLSQKSFEHRNNFARFCKCGNKPVSSEISLRRNLSTNEASFSGLVRCGSVWLCPECSAKVSTIRCDEVKTAIYNYTSLSADNAVYMLTLTHSHTKKDSLDDLLDNQKNALARFWRNGSVRRLLDDIGYVGRVSSFEVTYGQGSGWHPHRHILLFCKKQDNIKDFECKLRSYWVSALDKFDLYGNNYSLNLEGGAYADQYITKLSNEMTLSNLKRSPDGSERYTPFALLRHILDNIGKAPLWAVGAFQEYAVVTKGKKQLVWSKGLKELLGIQSVSDEEILEEADNPPDVIFEEILYIPYLVYRRLRANFKVYHEFLAFVQTATFKEIYDYLDSGGYLVGCYLTENNIIVEKKDCLERLNYAKSA